MEAAAFTAAAFTAAASTEAASTAAGSAAAAGVEAAGGVPVLAVAGARSRRLTWEEIGTADVDFTIFMPCGFDLEGAVAQAPGLLAHPQAARLGRIVAVDANAYFSRPGPRVVEGVELLERLLHGPRRSDVPGAQVLRLEGSFGGPGLGAAAAQ